MNDCSVPAGGPRECASRWMYGLSLFCVFAGLAVMIGGFIVRSASVVNEMSASANLVIPGDSAVMSDSEFIHSLLLFVINVVGALIGFIDLLRYRTRREAMQNCLALFLNLLPWVVVGTWAWMV